MGWLRRLFQKTVTEKRLDAELRFHLEQRVRDYVASGLDPEEAQRRAKEGGDADDTVGASAEAERKPVITRDKLPDLATTPLEIVSDDLAPATAPKPAPRPEPMLEPLEAPPAPKPARATASASATKAAAKAAAEEQTQAAGRASARKVFEAKFREPNPKLPFYITMGALGVFAVSTVIYFWYQLRPPPSLVNLNPPRQAETTVADLFLGILRDVPRPTLEKGARWLQESAR